MSEKLTIQRATNVFKVLKVFGFASFTIENGKPVTKLTDLIYIFASVSVGFMLIFFLFKYRDELANTKSELIDLGNFISIFAALSIAMISILISFLFRYSIWKIVLGLCEVVNTFERVGVAEDYGNDARTVLIVIAVIMSLSIPLAFGIYLLEGLMLKSCMYLFASLYFMLTNGQVVVFMNALTMRIKTVNNVCKSLELHPNEVRIVKNDYVLNNDHEVIATLVEVNLLFIKIIDKLSLCFGVQTMLSFGLVFFYTIFITFAAYQDLTINGYLRSYAAGELVCSIYLNFFLISVIYVCTITNSEAQKTLSFSNEIIKRLQSKDKKKVDLLMTLNYLIMRNSYKFSCGLFDFDWSLVYAVSLK